MTWDIISREITRKSISYLDLYTKPRKLRIAAIFYFRFLRNNNAKKSPLRMVLHVHVFYEKSPLCMVPFYEK